MISSSGPSANACCDDFGIYEEAGRFNNCIYLRQKDSNNNGKVLYQSRTGFRVGPSLDMEGSQSTLVNEITPTGSYLLPLSGWKFLDLGEYSFNSIFIDSFNVQECLKLKILC